MPVNEYDIFLPLFHNNGRPVEPRKFERLKSKLVDRFGAATFFPQPNEGYWRMSGVMYRDSIVILRIIAPGDEDTERYLTELKGQIMVEFDQKEVLIVVRAVRTL